MTVFYSGRVQGVGFRYTVKSITTGFEVTGTVRNLDDGRVEVYAIGTREQLDTLAGHLWKGPHYADVRGVEEQEAPPEKVSGFDIDR